MEREAKMSNLAKNGWWIALLVLAAAGTLWNTPGRSGEAAVVLPAPALDNVKSRAPCRRQSSPAAASGACRACTSTPRACKKVLSGYSVATRARPTTKRFGTGRTGHAESVQIVFDPKEISYGEILRIYFSVAHDPTELDRQGPDVGTQYRSAIFYGDAEQQRIARPTSRSWRRRAPFRRPIVTRVDPLKGFYPLRPTTRTF